MISCYREYPPHPALAPYVACYWSVASAAEVRNRVLPDACIDIVFAGSLKVVGAMRRAAVLMVSQEQAAAGIRFKPGGAAAFLRLPLHEVTDEQLPLDALWGCEGEMLSERLMTVFSTSDRIGLLEATLLHRLASITQYNPTVQYALHIIRRSQGNVSVTTLRTTLALSERQLERSLQQATGLAPRELTRITRFQQAVHLLRRPGISLTETAHQAGYYDQAHFIRDFKALAGVTPGGYRQEQQNVGFVQLPDLTT